MPFKVKRTSVLFMRGDCPSCDFEANARNAMGLAAQHADRTGHTAWVEVTYAIKPRGGTA